MNYVCSLLNETCPVRATDSYRERVTPLMGMTETGYILYILYITSSLRYLYQVLPSNSKFGLG